MEGWRGGEVEGLVSGWLESECSGFGVLVGNATAAFRKELDIEDCCHGSIGKRSRVMCQSVFICYWSKVVFGQTR